MKLILIVMLLSVVLLQACSYKGGEIWRRKTCQSIVDAGERAKCLEEATRPENEYKQDVDSATGS